MDLLLKLYMYGQMLQQKFTEITVLDVVSEDSEILEQLKGFSASDIGLFLVEPEIPKEGAEDQTQDVVYMQFIVAKKIADRISLKETMQHKDTLLNLAMSLDQTIQRHKEDSGDFAYQFSTTDDALPDEDVSCELMNFLQVNSIQKVPVSMSKIYIGWTINFKLKLS